MSVQREYDLELEKLPTWGSSTISVKIIDERRKTWGPENGNQWTTSAHINTKKHERKIQPNRPTITIDETVYTYETRVANPHLSAKEIKVQYFKDRALELLYPKWNWLLEWAYKGGNHQCNVDLVLTRKKIAWILKTLLEEQKKMHDKGWFDITRGGGAIAILAKLLEEHISKKKTSTLISDPKEPIASFNDMLRMSAEAWFNSSGSTLKIPWEHRIQKYKDLAEKVTNKSLQRYQEDLKKQDKISNPNEVIKLLSEYVKYYKVKEVMDVEKIDWIIKEMAKIVEKEVQMNQQIKILAPIINDETLSEEDKAPYLAILNSLVQIKRTNILRIFEENGFLNYDYPTFCNLFDQSIKDLTKKV